MTFLIPILFIVSAIAAFSFGRSYFGKLDRRRITENVIENGGKILRIALHSPSRIGNRSDKVYNVAFKTRAGKRITTMCMASVSSGVIWINDKPPETGVEISGEPEPIESINCLQCGTKISSDTSHCPQCGWSYKESER